MILSLDHSFKIPINSGNNTWINVQPSQSTLDVLRYDIQESCQNTHHPSSLPCLKFPPFLCSWIRIEGFIFSPTVFVFPPCSSNRREGTSRKHTVRSQNNTLGSKIRVSPFCFCFVLRQSQIVKSQEYLFVWHFSRCTCLGLLKGRKNGSGEDTKGDKKHQVDVYQLFDTMQVE